MKNIVIYRVENADGSIYFKSQLRETECLLLGLWKNRVVDKQWVLHATRFNIEGNKYLLQRDFIDDLLMYRPLMDIEIAKFKSKEEAIIETEKLFYRQYPIKEEIVLIK